MLRRSPVIRNDCASAKVANLTPGGVQINAHEVGRTPTSLGLGDRKRTNAGYILWLDLRTRKRVHTLAHEHDVNQEPWFTGEGFDRDCGLCKELADSNRGSAELKRDAGTKPGPK
jgi:hypothetical protein